MAGFKEAFIQFVTKGVHMGISESLGKQAGVPRGYPPLPVVLALCASVALPIPARAAQHLLVSILTEAGVAQTTGASPPVKLAAMPPAIRAEIDRVASDDPGKRATGALSLGQMGAAATPAIPYLVPLLGDRHTVFAAGRGPTDVTKVAAEALVDIGPKGVEALINVLLAGEDPYRTSIEYVLGKKAVRTAIPALIVRLRRPDVGDTEGLEILTALAAMNETSSLAPIMAFVALDAIKDYMWYRFQEPVKQLTGQDFKTKADALAWWNQNPASRLPK